ncbi:glycosyltransferase [Dendronalium sp. ChiSLP03b]|uniref:glycosyltransferase n=1 Tax=Dendronalium sp. ChiSLP03b TaxID=3075381 RepID=UPI002AD38E4D|nr:glycosyltransferase [Dendronalium sp. ChiSLP03b]MDZ8208340.1 glycosyltransferase [Dendronalium sp. ChiSLP03b]
MTSRLIVVIIPVFNDWHSLDILLKYLDEALNGTGIQCEILVINDASTIATHDSLILESFQTIKKVNCLELKRNLGHQRAIAIGLAYVEANIYCQAVVVMDGDGEDAPRDVIKLIEKCSEEKYQKIVFAKRTQRSETQIFKLFYLIYRLFYKLLTGQDIRVGNFSIIPHKLLSRIVVVSEIWNHYTAGILKAKIPWTQIPCKRGVRLAGQSKMKFVSLVIHGLSAISVYGDIIGVRLLIGTLLVMLFSLILISIVVLVRVAIPNWAPYVAGLSFIILLQSMSISLSFVFLILNGRNNFGFLPQRDYHHFILELQQLFPKA